jgi:hypothetical protein
MMRVRSDIHSLLRHMAEEQGVSMQVVLDRALEDYRRALVFEKAEQSYRTLRANREAWQQELDERALWDATLHDGLERHAQPSSPDDIFDVAY